MDDLPFPNARVLDVMTPNMIARFTDDSEGLGHKMQHHHLRGWPVANREQHLVGMVTSAQLEEMSLGQSFSTT